MSAKPAAPRLRLLHLHSSFSPGGKELRAAKPQLGELVSIEAGKILGTEQVLAIAEIDLVLMPQAGDTAACNY